MSTLRERVSKELEKWRSAIVDNEPRNGPLGEADAILRLIAEDRRALVEAVKACQAEAQCYCDGCKRIRAMQVALAAAGDVEKEEG